MTKREENKALAEIYKDAPVYEPSEDELEDQYRRYESFLKKTEGPSLDLDFDPE